MTDRPTVQPTARPTARTLDEAEQLIDRLQTEVRRLTRHAFALDRNWSSYADRNLAGIRAALGMMDVSD
jgi:predicted AAA+ superfamily ATPase